MNQGLMSVKKYDSKGSGFDSVGRVVTSNKRGPQLESSHKQNL